MCKYIYASQAMVSDMVISFHQLSDDRSTMAKKVPPEFRSVPLIHGHQRALCLELMV